MSESTVEEQPKRRRWVWLLLLLLLLLLAGLAYFFTRPTPPNPDGSFRSATLKGCDSAGRCIDFYIYAPGFNYAWVYDRAEIAALKPGSEPFERKISDDLANAEAVVVAGLASQEGGEDFNRWLSACRARTFEGVVLDAQNSAGGSATLYRASLGRYQGEPIVASVGVPEGSATQLQRLLVLAFVTNSEAGVDMAEALKDGIAQFLTPELERALPEVAAQLSFDRYSCWEDEFELTPIGARSTMCFTELTDNYQAQCAAFNN